METKQKSNKQNEDCMAYEKPAIKVIEMELEAAICNASGGGYEPGGGFGS